MTIGLEPSGWSSVTWSSSQKIFITNASLTSLPPGSYVWVKDIDISRRFYGGYSGLVEEMAIEARKAGADAVFELEKHYHVSMFAWAVPEVRGKAILLKDPCVLSGIGGDIYPRDEADTPQNRPITAQCGQV